MIGAETIRDPNVAAYLVHYCWCRTELVEPPHRRLSWWGRLFTWEPWSGAPAKGATRIGRRILATKAFQDRMAFYLTDYRMRGREARPGYEIDCCRPAA